VHHVRSDDRHHVAYAECRHRRCPGFREDEVAVCCTRRRRQCSDNVLTLGVIGDGEVCWAVLLFELVVALVLQVQVALMRCEGVQVVGGQALVHATDLLVDRC
jgi:hypothetical protein